MSEDIVNNLKQLGKQILQKLSFTVKKNDTGFNAEANIDEAKVTVKKEGSNPVNFSVDYKHEE